MDGEEAKRWLSEVTHTEIGESFFGVCGGFSTVADRIVLGAATAANPNAER